MKFTTVSDSDLSRTAQLATARLMADPELDLDEDQAERVANCVQLGVLDRMTEHLSVKVNWRFPVSGMAVAGALAFSPTILPPMVAMPVVLLCFGVGCFTVSIWVASWLLGHKNEYTP